MCEVQEATHLSIADNLHSGILCDVELVTTELLCSGGSGLANMADRQTHYTHLLSTSQLTFPKATRSYIWRERIIYRSHMTVM